MTAQTTTTTAAVTMTGGDVLEALAAVRPALSRRRNAHPWERSVWLLVSREGAQLRCNTGEVSASVDFDAQCEENERMSAHVDAQTLQQALQTHATRRGKGAATVLEVSVDEARLTIATGGAAATSCGCDTSAATAVARVGQDGASRAHGADACRVGGHG